MKSPTVLGFFLFGVLVKKLLSVLLCCLTLTACSSKGGFSIPELPSSSPALEFENMYLRGVFIGGKLIRAIGLLATVSKIVKLCGKWMLS